MGEGGGYWDGFVNGNDSFHNVINMLDFPLESVEGDSGVNVGDWESQFQRLGPISSQVLQGINAPVSRANVANIFVPSDATYERKQRPDIPEIYSSSTPHDSSTTKESSFFRTSPTSVLESSSACSAEKSMSSSPELIIPVRPRTKIPRRLTFNKWHLLSPVTPSKRNMKEKFHKKKKKKLIHLLADFEIKESPSGHQIPSKRCTHCQATETPQWRRGPPGRKMLCNACGVRYRHDRLFADYGPATELTQLSAYSETVMLSTFSEKFTKHSAHSEIKIIFPQRVSIKRCSRCQVTETPQWREGPTGQGTLCNACGVRYRHGSLSQEYPPAVKLAKLSVDSEKVAQHSANTEKVAQHSANTEKVAQHSARSEKPAKSSSHSETKENSSHQHAPVKRCTHCQVTKTPQWREGPMGRKTLCNACGVRYRSGRLLPEYRPAASPTFVPTLHSNSHRKVVEMRSQSIQDSLKPETDPAVSPTPEFVPLSSYLFDHV